MCVSASASVIKSTLQNTRHSDVDLGIENSACDDGLHSSSLSFSLKKRDGKFVAIPRASFIFCATNTHIGNQTDRRTKTRFFLFLQLFFVIFFPRKKKIFFSLFCSRTKILCSKSQEGAILRYLEPRQRLNYEDGMVMIASNYCRRYWIPRNFHTENNIYL